MDSSEGLDPSPQPVVLIGEALIHKAHNVSENLTEFLKQNV